MPAQAVVLRHSFANPQWWSWHRFLYACHINYRDVNGVLY